ncbi:hypothetical protein CC80DRAFT_548620 [Byssothecium circinans]|uniref:Uncharacterized protein n=1 Tax=Byssothecium circinans TaxID=147558 RepID=A0A6A5TXE6_9PLEO|nr:hypothetical protein CC80DRAFT_548620 [Byssothecium circinans]
MIYDAFTLLQVLQWQQYQSLLVLSIHITMLLSTLIYLLVIYIMSIVTVILDPAAAIWVSAAAIWHHPRQVPLLFFQLTFWTITMPYQCFRIYKNFTWNTWAVQAPLFPAQTSGPALPEIIMPSFMVTAIPLVLVYEQRWLPEVIEAANIHCRGMGLKVFLSPDDSAFTACIQLAWAQAVVILSLFALFVCYKLWIERLRNWHWWYALSHGNQRPRMTEEEELETQADVFEVEVDDIEEVLTI